LAILDAVSSKWHDRVVRLLVLDESPLFRRRLIVGLEHHDDIEVMAEAADAHTAIVRATELAPDVVFLTAQLPPDGGVTAAAAIRELLPGTAMLMIVGPDDEAELIPAVQAGVVGFAPREAVTGHGGPIARALAAGRPVLTARVATALIEHHDPTVPDLALGEAERTCLEHLAAGQTLGQVATQLGIPTATVANRVRNVLERLHGRARDEALLHEAGLRPTQGT
jgi:DNA-binding NarL/FixJ family response regulator